MEVLLHTTIYADVSAGDRSCCAAPSFTYITAVAFPHLAGTGIPPISLDRAPQGA